MNSIRINFTFLCHLFAAASFNTICILKELHAAIAFLAGFLIRDILRRIQIRILGSVHWFTDPDPDFALFVIGFLRNQQKIVSINLLNVHFKVHQFLKIASL
jgi:hypothetical protein